MLEDVPRLALEMGAGMRVGVGLRRVNLNRQIFARVEKLDQDRELTVLADQRDIAR